MSEERGREGEEVHLEGPLVLAPQFAGNALNLNKLRLCKQGLSLSLPSPPPPPPSSDVQKEKGGGRSRFANESDSAERKTGAEQQRRGPAERGIMSRDVPPTPISLHKNLQLKFKLKTETLNDASALTHLNSPHRTRRRSESYLSFQSKFL